MEATQELSDLYQNSNSVFCFLRRIKRKGMMWKEEGA